jgi:putative radical SAM enzyme (TIGR03279 family)
LIEVSAVEQGSAAARAGIRAGDRIISVNDHAVLDTLDFQFLAGEERNIVRLRRKGGRIHAIAVVRRPGEPLGLAFPPFPIRQCRNRCIFCFVDQMPGGCRPSLSVKDDDYRASFLFGNYLTLTNLREDDWKRIFDQRLSPLYLSVHATDRADRARLLRNAAAPDILQQMERLAAGGIRMHTQVVLCSGINDGSRLVKTLDDLAGLFPAVRSVAVVPVGLTSHRKGLYPLRTFRRNEARSVVELVHRTGGRFRRRLGTRLVFASDEFYIQAGQVIPPPAYYEDFPQIENGVGMVAAFLREARGVHLTQRVPPATVTAVTGASFGPILRSSLAGLLAEHAVRVRILTVPNSFFGPTVTVAGLLTGRDILRAARGKRLGSRLLIPANALKDDEGVFLDDMTVNDLALSLGVPVTPVGGFRELRRILQSIDRQEGTL